MTPSSAPPSPGCGSSTLLLQRRLLGRDCGKWRTVARLMQSRRGEAQDLAAQAKTLDPLTEWRIVDDAPDSEVLLCVGADGRGYVTIAEHDRVRRKMDAFRRVLARMADAFAVLEIESANDWQEHKEPLPAPDWAAPTEPAPLGD